MISNEPGWERTRFQVSQLASQMLELLLAKDLGLFAAEILSLLSMNCCGQTLLVSSEYCCLLIRHTLRQGAAIVGGIAGGGVEM